MHYLFFRLLLNSNWINIFFYLCNVSCWLLLPKCKSIAYSLHLWDILNCTFSYSFFYMHYLPCWIILSINRSKPNAVWGRYLFNYYWGNIFINLYKLFPRHIFNISGSHLLNHMCHLSCRTLLLFCIFLTNFMSLGNIFNYDWRDIIYCLH